jgi:hypothetical protein
LGLAAHGREFPFFISLIQGGCCSLANISHWISIQIVMSVAPPIGV